MEIILFLIWSLIMICAGALIGPEITNRYKKATSPVEQESVKMKAEIWSKHEMEKMWTEDRYGNTWLKGRCSCNHVEESLYYNLLNHKFEEHRENVLAAEVIRIKNNRRYIVSEA